MIRADVLRRTSLIGPYIASDRPFLAELALYGKFLEVPEFLFYRRLHANAYSSQKDASKLLEFYDPRISNRIPLTTWRHFGAKFRAVARAQLNMAEKIRLHRFLVRSAIYSRHDFLR